MPNILSDVDKKAVDHPAKRFKVTDKFDLEASLSSQDKQVESASNHLFEQASHPIVKAFLLDKNDELSESNVKRHEMPRFISTFKFQENLEEGVDGDEHDRVTNSPLTIPFKFQDINSVEAQSESEKEDRGLSEDFNSVSKPIGGKSEELVAQNAQNSPQVLFEDQQPRKSSLVLSSELQHYIFSAKQDEVAEKIRLENIENTGFETDKQVLIVDSVLVSPASVSQEPVRSTKPSEQAILTSPHLEDSAAPLFSPKSDDNTSTEEREKRRDNLPMGDAFISSNFTSDETNLSKISSASSFNLSPNISSRQNGKAEFSPCHFSIAKQVRAAQKTSELLSSFPPSEVWSERVEDSEENTENVTLTNEAISVFYDNSLQRALENEITSKTTFDLLDITPLLSQSENLHNSLHVQIDQFEQDLVQRVTKEIARYADDLRQSIDQKFSQDYSPLLERTVFVNDRSKQLAANITKLSRLLKTVTEHDNQDL